LGTKSDAYRYGETMGGKLEEIQETLRNDTALFALADFFRVLGDSTRVKIIYALSGGELRVMDIARLLDMGQSAISHQLRVLKQARFVKNRRAGKTVYYTLYDEHLKAIFSQGYEHVRE